MDIGNDIIGHLTLILEQAKTAIQQRMDEENVNASGRTSEAMRVVRRDGTVALVIGAGDVAPLATLEVGRKGGKVPQGFYQIILQWSRDKGIPFANDRERRTFAYFVSRKIARVGTVRNRQPVDVYSSIVTEAAEHVMERTTAEITRYIHDEIIKIQ